MRSTLDAIRRHPRLTLQLVVTGMHLDPRHGRTIAQIRRDGWHVDATVRWPPADSALETAARTGTAVTGFARAFARLRPEIVLVVGDRVEAFAAAAAAHIGGIPVAHVHGGDRALGQVDDALRHAITKLSHLHFPATRHSAARIRQLGEDAWRVYTVGSPGIDGIRSTAAPRAGVASVFPTLRPRQYALIILHPTDANARAEHRRANRLIDAARRAGFEQLVVIDPNNDPGSAGIRASWLKHERAGQILRRPDVPRTMFLGLMRDAAVLVGNSSSGIIEAASFGTPVVDVGPRQLGRERSGNVTAAAFEGDSLDQALTTIWNRGHPRRSTARNLYGGSGTGEKIADVLARVPLDQRLLRKLISY